MATAAEDKSDNRTIDDYVQDTLALLQMRNLQGDRLNLHSLRSWVHKISDDLVKRQKSVKNRIPGYDPHWTKSAWDLRAEKKTHRLHLEHPVPRGKIVRWLCELPNPSEEAVRRAIDLFLLTCWVTTGKKAEGTYKESEECDLNSNGFKNSMPPSWCALSGDKWARYEQVKEQTNGRLSDWATFEVHQQRATVRD